MGPGKRSVDFTYCPGDDADIQLSGQGLVPWEIRGGFRAGREEFGVVRHPRREMVFRKDGNMSAFGRRLPDVYFGDSEVGLWCDGLWGGLAMCYERVRGRHDRPSVGAG